MEWDRRQWAGFAVVVDPPVVADVMIVFVVSAGTAFAAAGTAGTAGTAAVKSAADGPYRSTAAQTPHMGT